MNERPPAALRDLLQLLRAGVTPMPLDEVEPAAAIVRALRSAGMRLGALSPEAHEALAIAMNRLGGRSNSGEGGEDPARYGTDKSSKIKQVASGRFGVTPRVPGQRRSAADQDRAGRQARRRRPAAGPQGQRADRAAALRDAGIGLISPPPHHDIYSIEDLAQLIYDLKQVNPTALVSVKLVSHAGVGTIAAGVVKAGADLVTISGHDGGTGASPLSSIHYAGTPWELGLAEAQQALLANDLRERVSAAGRRRPQDRPGRGQGGAARRGELRLRHRADDRAGLQVPAHLPPQQLRHRRRHAGRRAARATISPACRRW